MSARIAKPSSRTPWFEVTTLGSGTHRLRLGGGFGPTWMPSLCAGLATHRLSIERAHAVRANDFSWMAEMTLRSGPGSTHPSRVPYLALASRSSGWEGAPLEIREFEISETPAHGGTLRLTLEAGDVLGLLGGLLWQLAGLQLFAVEMHIETREGCAYDRLWLATVEGRSPKRPMRDELEALMCAARRNSAPPRM